MEYKHRAQICSFAFITFLLLSPRLTIAEVGKAAEHRTAPIVPGQFIVVTNGGVDPALVASDHAAISLHTYRVASRGFAARLSDEQVNRLRSDPRVNNVIADRRVATAHHRPGHGGDSTGGTAEIIPTGLNRIDAETVSATAEIAQTIVAIIDTGIDLDHPDLNISSTCSYSAYDSGPSAADDGNGHGTHVAGTVGAKANTSGVKGVAPGVELCPIKVLDNSGSGTWSSIIAGIEYVTAQKNSGANIKAANMSLGGCATIVFIWCSLEPPPGNDSCGQVNGTVQDPLHQAICNSTAAGVIYIVAAGNDDEDAGYFVPAAYPEVITVSAIADYDGKGGGRQKPARGCNYGPDDSFASFSNYGQAVDIAAPGVCINSTYKGGGTKSLSGTSMAAPHVTGAIAAMSLLYVTPGDKNAPRDLAMEQLKNGGKSQTDPSCGFSGDPDGLPEPLVYVGYTGASCN